MLPDIFLPEMQSRLESASPEERTEILHEELSKSFGALPKITGRLRDADHALSVEQALAKADEFLGLYEERLAAAGGGEAEHFKWYGMGEHSAAWIRLPFLGSFVIAHRQTGDEKYVRAAHHFIMDYVQQFWKAPDEVPEGENHLCPGIHLGAWHQMHRHGGLYTAMREWHAHPLFTGDDLIEIFRCITHIANWLRRNLVLGTNQRLYQLEGIFTQAMCYPFLKHAETWRQTGVNSLNEDFDMQFLDDGSFQEPTIGYGKGSWTHYTKWFALSREAPQLGLHFDEASLERTQEYYLSCLKPFGKHAAIGDVWTVRGPEELKVDSQPRKTLDWSFLSEPVSVTSPYTDWATTRFILEGGAEPEWTTRFNSSVGYLYMRNDWQPESLYMNFNLGYYTNPHCHYGLLGIEAAGFGREFIVDPGNAGYNSHPLNANMYKTRGHSTMTVDGLNQSARGPVQITRMSLGERYDFAIGVYMGGFVNGSQRYGWEGGVSGDQFRHVLFVKGDGCADGLDGYWVVLDAMQSRPGHMLETRFQFMPTEMRTLPDGGYCTGWAEGNLALLPLHWDGWDHGIHCGEEDPIEGWLPVNPNPEFTPAPLYKATRPTTNVPHPADWHGTLLLPYRAADMPQVKIERIDVGPIGFAWQIEAENWTDVLFVSNSFHPNEYRMGPVESDCPVCHHRFVDGKPVWGYTCDGNYLTIDGRDSFRKPGSMKGREYTYGKTTDVREIHSRLKAR